MVDEKGNKFEKWNKDIKRRENVGDEEQVGSYQVDGLVDQLKATITRKKHNKQALLCLVLCSYI